MRNKFDEQLEQLNVALIKTGALCEDAISTAAKALLDNDMELAKKVKPIELEIDQKEREIENLCMRLLLQQQPVAGDLRQISSALKMITDLERIGDQTSDIAELLPYLQQGDITFSKVHIKEMAEATIKTVSYTHLDVYKRQSPGSSANRWWECPRAAAPCTGPSSSLPVPSCCPHSFKAATIWSVFIPREPFTSTASPSRRVSFK